MQATARPRVLADVFIPAAAVQSRANRLAIDAALVIGFAFVIAICAQLAFKLPTTTVPITGQTFGILVSGGALGSKRGGAAALLYMLVGMVGLPVFAPTGNFMAEKSAHFVFPWLGGSGLLWNMSSGGYIVGFVVAAFIVGWLAEKGWDRQSKGVLAMLIGSVAVYVFGLAWLAVYIQTHAPVNAFFEGLYPGSSLLVKTLNGGLFPFVGGDALKLVLASLALPGAWALVSKIKGEPKG
ncbi:MAG: biotin transporter BioY [SAR202 cluster bacterium]|nr:biotin transporter BioY [SAR202 cluster bacterium]